MTPTGPFSLAAAIKIGVREVLITWPIEELLKGMVRIVHDELRPLDEKLSKLIHAPFETAERFLELAREYPRGSTEQLSAIEKAKELFNAAASHLEGIKKVHALYLAGLCCDLKSDQIGKNFFYKKALEEARRTVEEIRDYKIYDKNLKGVGASLGGMFGGAAIGAAVGGPIGLVVAIGLSMAGVGVALAQDSGKTPFLTEADKKTMKDCGALEENLAKALNERRSLQ